MTATPDSVRSNQPAGSHVWTIDAVRKLSATVDVETAGAILGIGRSKAYELARAGEFPVQLLRIGRRYVVPTQSIRVLLGIDG